MDEKLFNIVSRTRANFFGSDLHGEWKTQANGDIKWDVPIVLTGGIGRVPIDKPVPTSRIVWISAFQHLINATWGIHHHAKLEIWKRHPMDPIDSFHFCVRCFLLWNIRCREMVNRHLPELRSARLKVTTPSDLIQIGSISFAEHVLRLAEQRQEWLFRFITHDAHSFSLLPEERIIFEAQKIVESWTTISPLWPFNDLDGPHLIGLVDLEACNCHFLWQNQRDLSDPPEPQDHKSQNQRPEDSEKEIPGADLVDFTTIAQRLRKAGYPISRKRLSNLYREPAIRKLWGPSDGKKGNAFLFKWSRLRPILASQFATELTKPLE